VVRIAEPGITARYLVTRLNRRAITVRRPDRRRVRLL